MRKNRVVEELFLQGRDNMKKVDIHDAFDVSGITAIRNFNRRIKTKLTEDILYFTSDDRKFWRTLYKRDFNKNHKNYKKMIKEFDRLCRYVNEWCDKHEKMFDDGYKGDYKTTIESVDKVVDVRKIEPQKVFNDVVYSHIRFLNEWKEDLLEIIGGIKLGCTFTELFTWVGYALNEWESKENNILDLMNFCMKHPDTKTGVNLFEQNIEDKWDSNWKKVGSSAGKIILKPDDEQYLYWNKWVKKNYPDEFYHATHSTGPKQNVINLIFRKLNIKSRDYENEHEKGVYFCMLYKNGKDYLTGKIKESELIIDERVDRGLDYILSWWIPKAEKRYNKLLKSERLQDESLWYEGINSTKVESWLRSRGVNGSIHSNHKVNPLVVDRMFRKVGIDKNIFYQSLKVMGKEGLKTKKMKEEWNEENPTRNYCYVVSEFIYKYVAPKGVKHLSLKVDGDDVPHHYLKWTDGTIIDLTAEQFSDYNKIDYSKGYPSGFIGKGVSKRTQEFAHLMGYK